MNQHHATIDGLLDELNVDQLSAMLQERARKRQHASAKLLQPDVAVTIPDDQWAKIVADWSRPITDEERQAQGLEFMCLSLRDCMMAGQREDSFFAALRICRWVFAHSPVGPTGDGK